VIDAKVTMANARREKPGLSDAPRTQNRRAIPTDSGGAQYPDELDLYLDQLLDEALEELAHGSDAASRRVLDKK
jgi:hypothetical protein